MPLFRQLELDFTPHDTLSFSPDPAPIANGDAAVVGQALRLTILPPASGALALQFRCGRDHMLEALAADLLQANGAGRIARQIRVEWTPRLKSSAGRADYKAKLISLNPRLHQHGTNEINQTFLHELAHLLAQFRSGRKRIAPHGKEWRLACKDLGIPGEKRCHSLPFPVRQRACRYLYRCPNCGRDFPRVRRIRRAVACLACCRALNGSRFDARFRLRLIGYNVGQSTSAHL